MLLYIQYNMDKLSKSELFQIISQQSKNIAALTKQVKQLIDVNKQLIERNKPVPAPRTEKIMEQPIPAPRKNVNKMIKEYEENIKPIPPPRTKIKQVNKALRAAACKNRELHFSDHLVEFLIFRLKIPLD